MKNKEAKNFFSNWWVWLVWFTITGLNPPLGIILLLVMIGFIIYCNLYFKGEKFKSIKQNISSYIADCNELNSHIEELRSTYADTKKTDYGEASFQNISRYNYNKKGIQNAKYEPNVYDCSRTVCDNARKQPFKYICKYFNINATEESLEQFENVLNNFISAEEGKIFSINKKNKIMNSISKDINWLVKRLYKKRLEKELGFSEFRFNEIYFPIFSFRYISAGGNSGTKFDIVMDISMLERFINYLADLVKFKKSVEGQRRLMTPKLRKYIIERDFNTCQKCSNSTANEPNLLLEVDHKVPVSKGGITTEDNLQTLCWKCNRHKGAKTAFN